MIRLIYWLDEHAPFIPWALFLATIVLFGLETGADFTANRALAEQTVRAQKLARSAETDAYLAMEAHQECYEWSLQARSFLQGIVSQADSVR